MPKLVACPSCHEHIKNEETACPHCGASVRTCRAFGRGAGAILMGLTLSACPSDDGTESETMASSTMTTAGSTGMATDASTGTTQDMDTGTFESAAAYGTPDTGNSLTEDITGPGSSSSGDTDTDTGTDTETDTDTGGTTLEPEYGVPTTSG